MTTLVYNEYVVPRSEAITLDIPQRFPKWAGLPFGDNHLIGFLLQWHFGVPFEVCYVFDQSGVQKIGCESFEMPLPMPSIAQEI